MIQFRGVESKKLRLDIRVQAGDLQTQQFIREDDRGFQEVLRKTFKYMEGQLLSWEKERESKKHSEPKSPGK